jgi:2-methylcitrate dehydratase
MTEVEELADFVCSKSIHDLSEEARHQLKIRILDALGCAIGAQDSDLARKVREHVHDMGEGGPTSLIGGKKSSPEHGTFYNSALIRYLDFNDSYLALGETCHPSDNLGAILAATEYKNATGEELLCALAIAYQVQCRLSDVAPVRAKGLDHTTQGAYAVAAGVAKALRLNPHQTANAIAISGTSNLALRVSRTGMLSNWKGLAYPQTAFIGVHSTFLAMRGITGPLLVFEGNKGFKSLAGDFTINWKNENLECVNYTIIKKYNAEIHSQSCLEATLELQSQNKFKAADIDSVEIDIFEVAYHIIGGGEEGDKANVKTKEEADHSLRYLVAVALLDGEVMPAQFESSRIVEDDVKALMMRIVIRPKEAYSKLFPSKVACSVRIKLKSGHTLFLEKMDYRGFFTRPFAWSDARNKFEQLTMRFIDAKLQKKIIESVEGLEALNVKDLTQLLSTTKEQIYD